MWTERLKAAFWRWLSPPYTVCALCDEEALIGADGLCSACRANLRPAPSLPLSFHVDGAAAAFLYEGSIKKAVHRLKYENARYLAPWFAARMRPPAGWHPQCIIPVPLHEKRLIERGYNQSELLAQALGKELHIPVETDLLLRVRDTGSQTHLNERERHKNVAGAFWAAPGCRGKRILLIDDVRTTGSTLEACAKSCKEAGAAKVFTLCACTAPK